MHTKEIAMQSSVFSVVLRCPSVAVLYYGLLLIALAASAQQPASHPPKEGTTRTRVVLLGTGTPVPDPDRSGPATAIAVDDSVYLVDFGPGVVRRAKAAVL